MRIKQRLSSIAPPRWVYVLFAIAAAFVLVVTGTVAGTSVLPAASALPCPDGSQTCGPQPTQDPGPTQGNQAPTTAPQAPQTTIPPNTDTGAPSAPTQGNGNFQGTVQSAPTADNPNGCIVNCGPTQTQAPAQTPTTAQPPPQQLPGRDTNPAQRDPGNAPRENATQYSKECLAAMQQMGIDIATQSILPRGGGPGRFAPVRFLPDSPECVACPPQSAQKSYVPDSWQNDDVEYTQLSSPCKNGEVSGTCVKDEDVQPDGCYALNDTCGTKCTQLAEYGSCVKRCSFISCTEYLSEKDSKNLAKSMDDFNRREGGSVFKYCGYAGTGGGLVTSIAGSPPIVSLPIGLLGLACGAQSTGNGQGLTNVLSRIGDSGEGCLSKTVTGGLKRSYSYDNSGFCTTG